MPTANISVAHIAVGIVVTAWRQLIDLLWGRQHGRGWADVLRARSTHSGGLHIPARIALVEFEVLALRVGLVVLRRQAVTSRLRAPLLQVTT